MDDIKHILSIDQFDRIGIEEIFKLSATLEKETNAGDYLQGKILATLFFEPSTRTRLSFEAAFIKLGGQILSVENAFDNSSNKKGEPASECAKTISNYADFIVFRHPEGNSASEVAKVANCPIINAGSGSSEHPTQAILDLYTIWKEKGQIDGLKICIIGDLKHARTINSLKKALANFDVELFELDNFSGDMHELPEGTIEKCDVIYMTRNQIERHGNVALNIKFALGHGHDLKLKEKAIVLHPLPRGYEIDPSFDADPRARYWAQVKNGIAVRQALILYLAGYIKL
jgi:aspartate carbamoyltransferase